MTQLDTAGRIGINGITTVAVPVSDQERALDFFTQTLGFEKRRDMPFGPGLRWIEVAPPGAVTTIALAPHREGQPIAVDTGVRFATSDAESDQAALRARGVDVDDEVLRFGAGVPPMFYFRDPDGNRYVIVGGS